ncbi:phosphoribosyltransferase [Pelomicrobium methylotrophicum]|uniref:Phosphoribosyltransferase n=1 Tax=Pelomicrobium methylotrophicum TaxID=2602750 RepID=A0A5C7ET12_9PROT|nr:phosphoribosyltransferase [Pelomicrobium methylotrophicum]
MPGSDFGSPVGPGKESTVFKDRSEAARLLAERLAGYRGKNPLVLAVPRGAVPMGRIIADALGAELDVVLVRKLRAPDNPEFAIGSVDETGWAFVADHAARAGATQDYIEREKAHQLSLIRARRARYTPVRPPIDPQSRVVIVVDDGLATGATMISALHGLRQRKPQKLICAVPVAPPETVERVARYCDEMVCLEQPWNFYAVGQFYRHFPQVDDAEVIQALAGNERRADNL